tara:strand:+ start:319 stop:1044 length:726 start_codon:yes stop_codon:yes gene_type:complete
MKNKSIILLLTVTSIVALILIVILSNYIFELEYQINQKDNFIENSVKNDSLINEKTKAYADQIKNYVEDCNFKINGKTITQKEVLRIANKALDDNVKYRDSIRRLKFSLKNAQKDYGISYDVQRKGDTLISTRNITEIDTMLAYYPKLKKIEKKYYSVLDSLERYKWHSELVKKNFGISYKITKKNKQLKARRVANAKIDSALILLEYFRHRLSIDEDGDWVIDTDSKYRKAQRKKERSNN